MTTAPDPLDGYEEIAVISGRMLEAARCGDWDRMIAEERRCREAVAVLRGQGEVPLTVDEQRRKHSIIRKMLADDAEIRRFAEPWLARLEGLISASGNDRRLKASYGSQA